MFVLGGTHPNVWFSSTWGETIVTKAISKGVMPTGSTASEPIQCLANDQDVAFFANKFRTCNDVAFLGGIAFQVCIANIGCPNFQVIQLSKCKGESEAS